MAIEIKNDKNPVGAGSSPDKTPTEFDNNSTFSVGFNFRESFDPKEIATLTQGNKPDTTPQDLLKTDKDLTAALLKNPEAITEYFSPSQIANIGPKMAEWERKMLSKLPQDMRDLWKEDNNPA